MYSAAQQEANTYNAQYNTNITADEFFYYIYGMTVDNYKYYNQNVIKNEIIMYAIFDAEKLSYTEEEFNALLSEMATSSSTDKTVVTSEDIKEEYTNWQLETLMINKVVMKFLVDTAVIK